MAIVTCFVVFFLIFVIERMICRLLLVTLLLLGICMLIDAHGDHKHDHHHDHDHDHYHHHHDDDDEDDDEQSTVKTADVPKLDPEEVEYHKGSLCGYCEYCKVTFRMGLTNYRVGQANCLIYR